MRVFVILALAQTGGGQIEQIASTFGVDWPHLSAQIISFSLVCLLLYRLAYRPILAILDVRRRQIARGLANAEQIEAELARTKAARQQVLAQANEAAARVVEDAKEAATRVRLQETANAIADAKQIIASAQQAAAHDRVRMLGDLRREIGRLVVRTTAAVTGKILTPDDQRRLAEEAVTQLPS